MVVAVFYYTDGSLVEREFETEGELRNFVHAEGDHLEYWEFVDEME